MRGIVAIFFVVGIFYINRCTAQAVTKEPFFKSTIKRNSNGSIIQSIITAGGQIFPIVGQNEIEFLFYINGKSYTEKEANELDPTPFKTQTFIPVFSGNYQIEGRSMKDFMMILYVGEPPPLTDFRKKEQILQKKYDGKTIIGLVKGPTYSSYNNALMGFMLESGEEEFRVDINTNEVARLMKVVKPGDIVIIEVSHASLNRQSSVPIIFPKTLTKDGEMLIRKGSVQI